MAPPKKKPTLNIPPPPPPPAKKDAPKPLGVPDDYTATSTRRVDRFARVGPFNANPYGSRPQRSITSTIPPRFFEGDEYAPASFAPEKIARLQRELATAGLIGPKTKFRVGLWDEATRNAYKNLLEYANASGLDERTAIKKYAEAQVLDPSGETEARAPLTIKKTNPADLIAVADVAARTVMGRKLRPEEAARFAAQFQALEAGEQTTDYNQAETGGTSVAAPDARTFMMEKIRREYGQEAGAHDIAEQGNEFFDLLNQVGAGIGDPPTPAGKPKGKSAAGMDPAMAAKVSALITATGGRVYIKSGHRSTARQAQLWEAALAKYGSAAKARKWVAPPGRSNHEKGIAVDLGGDLELAARLAPQFGLYRPLSNEAWHFEPVGSRGKTNAPSASGQKDRQLPAPAAVTAGPVATEAPDQRKDLAVQLSDLVDILAQPIEFGDDSAAA